MEMASFSSYMKAKLMRNLKKIRTANYALKFCSFLIEAQEMQYKEGFLQDHQKYGVIYESIQNIVRHEPVEIVNIICVALCAPKENPCEEREQLLNILKSKCNEGHTEYLNQLIGALESLVKLLAPPDLYTCTSDLKVEDYDKPIVALKEFLITHGTHKIERAFSRMFHLGIKTFVVSLEEEKEIVAMTVEAMPYIKNFIKGYCSDFMYTLGIGRLQMRSALEFIRDLLTGYSVGHKNLRDFIGSLDEIIKTVDDESDRSGLFEDIIDTSGMNEEDYCVEFLNETLEDFYKAGALDVPKEHTWWQRYKMNFFSIFMKQPLIS